MVRSLLALSCFAIAALSQTLSIGAKGGLRLTGDVPPYRTSDSKRYLVGPMIEVGLPFHFAFEVDALYSRLGNTFHIPGIGNSSVTRTITNSWEFPLLLEYRLPVSRVSPFVSLGVAPRYAAGRMNMVHYGYDPGDVTFSSLDWHAHDRALVFGAGTGIKAGRVRITPEIRYLKWAVPRNPMADDVAFYLRAPRNDEVQFLLGIGWSKE